MQSSSPSYPLIAGLQQQCGQQGCHPNSSSRSSKLKIALGAITLLLTWGTLMAILLPHALTLLAAWCVVEMGFWIFVVRPKAQQLDAICLGPERPKLTDQDIDRAFNRFIQYCKDTPGGLDFKNYLSGWFLGADIDSIKRDNIEEFTAYGFCYMTSEEMRAAGQGPRLDRMMDQLEAVWGQQAPKGYNPDIQFMAHLREPLKAAYRPLAFYLLNEGVAWVSRLLLRRWGFQHHRHAGVTYHTLHLEAIGSPKGHHSAGILSSVRPVQNGFARSLTPQRAQQCSSTSAQLSPFVAQLNEQQRRLAAGSAPEQTATHRAGSAALLGIKEQELGSICERGPSQGSATEQLSNTASPTALTEVDVSPFATADSARLSGQLSDLICKQQVLRGTAQDEHAAASGGAARGGVPAAAAGGKWGKTSSVPATLAPTKQPPLQQHSSCSLPKAATSQMAGQAFPPLQAALSEAVSEAGVVEAGVPVVFLHGIGGLPAYLELLGHLMAGGNPLLAVEVKSVAMRMGHVYSVSEVSMAVLGMMNKMGIQQACIVAHSYGTFVASYLARLYPHRVRGCVLIDPVCLGMFMPTLIHSFLYRGAVWQGFGKPELVAYIKAFVRSCISREMHVRASVARRFYWTELNAWPETLPPGSTILLSGKDDLMDSDAVRRMLQHAEHLKVMYYEDLTHGAFLLDNNVKSVIKEEIRALLATSGSAVVGLAKTLSYIVHPHVAGAAAAAGAWLPGRSSVQRVLRKVSSVHVGTSSSNTDGYGVDGGAPGRGLSATVSEGAPARLRFAAGAGKWREELTGDAGCDVAAGVRDDQTPTRSKQS